MSQPPPKESDFSPKTKASLVHLGQMMGSPGDDFDEEVGTRLREHEANAEKMKQAARGGAGVEMGPSEFETQQAQQTQALDTQQALQGAQQAEQAQAAQMPIAAPTEAPGPAGAEQPYPAQKKQKPPPGPGQSGPPGPGEVP